MNVNVTYDNAEKGRGYYVDLVKREYTEEEQKKYGCTFDVDCVGFSENKENALEVAYSITKEYGCEVCEC